MRVDRDVLDKYFESQLKRMHLIARRVLRDDELAWDAVLIAAEKLIRTFTARPRDIENLDSYVYTTVVHTARELAGKEGRRPTPTDPTEEEVKAFLDDLSHIETGDVWNCLRSLDPYKQSLAYLYWIEDHSLDDVAADLGTNKNTLRGQIDRLKRDLLRCLDQAPAT